MQTEAPYTDPDGHPSWQADPLTREMDARHRRVRAAADKVNELSDLIAATKRTLQHLEQERDIAAMDEIIARNWKPSTPTA